MTLKTDALEYHSRDRRGKIEIRSTKPCSTQYDLSLAYTPGVAEPCREIHKNKAEVYKYTAKGNLVAVVTNGTAVLGLGNIGPEASKPVDVLHQTQTVGQIVDMAAIAVVDAQQ